MPDLAILSPFSWTPGRPHGGITPVIRNLTMGFASRGIKVDLLVRQYDSTPKVSGEMPEEVRIVHINTKGKLGTALAVADYLRSTAPPVLLSAGHRFNLSAAWASKMVGTTRVFLRVGNHMSREAEERGSFHRWIRLSSITHFYGWAYGIIANSEDVSNDLKSTTGLSKDKIHVIHNPVAPPELLRWADEPLDHPWFHPDSPPVILGVGRLARQKAFDILIRAFKLLRDRLDCRLVILGEGPESKELEDLAGRLGIKEELNLPGFVDNPYPYMKRSAVFALSSIYEGLPNVMVEALSVRTPAVSTDCPGGSAEILDGGRFGRLVPPNDPEALCEAIYQTILNPPEPSLLKEAIRPFELNTIVDRYIDCLGIRVAGPGKNTHP